MNGRYLLVVPVPFHPLPDGRAAIESAFATHLQALLASLRPRITELEVLAPAMDDAAYAASKLSLRELDPAADGIRCTPAYPLNTGRLRFLLGLPRLLLRLWRAVGRAAFVHAGPSPLWRPFENVALLFGWLARRTTVYVTDIDHRESPRMNVATGAWSRGVAFRARHLHGRWTALQHHLARWLCSTLFLKGQALVRDYGRGRAHVHYILDCAHGEDVVLDGARLDAKCRQLAAPGRPLRACYFGRLVAYKGVDRMLDAVAQARGSGAAVTFDIWGAGDAEPALRARVATLRLDRVVTFHAPLPYGGELFTELAQCDLLLAAPLSQDTPRSAIDAQALGLPVLAFDTYYYRELAAQGAGVRVVPWPDVAALAQALAA
ncbi:MAG: glycosyltransferase, partial [Planctomycetota bacterium]